ncbi:probable plastidic glucose transporter 3 [Camellia sinensis]|uniref:probable plastidic glucose transporter 3 n=1 Tax=Camellia sinensis TaxID=4442 RepID=UPI001036E47E|nr:probable plastidic glucose transporter 3 [Camellia sinensis]
MWGRKRDASSMYKRVSSKDHINGHYRDDDGRLHNGIGKETGNPSWKHSLPHVLVATFSSFLFGYHLGVVNDTLESISMDLGFSGNTIAEGLVVSTCLGGAFVGSLFSGWIADGVGRRRAFQLCALPMIIGASMSATTNTLGGMLLGRFFVGTGMGLGPPVAALYVSEVSPAFVRGTYGSFTQIATCLGLMGALFIGIPAKDIVGWWRVCFWVSAIPAAVLAVLMEFCAESPHWLFKRGRIAEAEIEFEKLLGGSHFKSAVSELSKSDRGDEADAVKFSELFYGRHFKVVFIGSTLFALQQLSGINAVFYFSSAVFRSVGVPSDIANICVGIANLSGSVDGCSSGCSQFYCIRLWGGVPISWRHTAVCLYICSWCWASTWSSPIRNISQPNQGKGNGSLHGCALGDKFFCWFILFALAGATWAANSVHNLCYILLDGCGFCKEECVGN